ncbi:hypothetical protein, conserved [Eimeria tenella]|uniref:Uncharacterized protein n=1 Tax=Eimeria tenella TaxID=5802 RepID=U6KMT8_EIMTE|nr:hypothetical protein, conserved [Eimeria tenella]CDJ39301.1 hypothetical protein, conserved [Eimeria tenella]|eukprot:XP_013230056.1 hypothetical protein, conserved [Eimeria tenella]
MSQEDPNPNFLQQQQHPNILGGSPFPAQGAPLHSTGLGQLLPLASQGPVQQQQQQQQQQEGVLLLQREQQQQEQEEKFLLQRRQQQQQQQPSPGPRLEPNRDLGVSAKADNAQATDAAPAAAAAATTAAQGRSPKSAAAQSTASKPVGPPTGNGADAEGPPFTSRGPAAPAGAPNVAAAGLLLLCGGWMIAALLLLSPFGCIPFLRHCSAARHNRAGVGDGPIGAPPQEGGPPGAPLGAPRGAPVGAPRGAGGGRCGLLLGLKCGAPHACMGCMYPL